MTQKIKNVILKTAAFVAIVSVAIFLVFIAIRHGNTNDTIGASIIYTEGNVEYKKEGGGWFSTTQDTHVKEGYSVRTLTGSKAIINIDDGSTLRLDENSKVTFASLDPNNIIIENKGGYVYSRVAKADRKFTVKVEDYQFQSLGTAYTTVNTKELKGVKVYESKVKIIYEKEGENKEITTEEGNKYYIENLKNTDHQEKIVKISPQNEENKDFLKWNKEKDNDLDQQDQQKDKEEDNQAKKDEVEKDTQTQENDQKEENDPKTEYDNEESVTGENSHEEQEGQTAETNTRISATGRRGNLGIHIDWTVEGNMDTSKGFKIVYSSSSQNPTFPDNKSVYVSDTNKRTQFISMQDGVRYYFRVCRYTGESCDNYSSTVMITAPVPTPEPTPSPEPEPNPTPEPTPTKSINLSAGSNQVINWSSNFVSSQGYKITWSQNTNPTYPGRSGDKIYYVNKNTTSHTLEAFSGSGTYYVRICEYLDGTCETYSNQVSVNLTTPQNQVNSIILSASNNGNVNWSVNGYSAQGYKITWSKSPNPQYPPRQASVSTTQYNQKLISVIEDNIYTDKVVYISNPNTTSYNITDAFDGAGQYYVRICEYIGGGKCGVYSNQVTISL